MLHFGLPFIKGVSLLLLPWPKPCSLYYFLSISNILIVINQSLKNTVNNLLRIITTQSWSVSISSHASLRTLHWPLWCHSIPDYLTVLLGRMVTNRSSTYREWAANWHEHWYVVLFHVFSFLLFFPLITYLCGFRWRW